MLETGRIAHRNAPLPAAGPGPVAVLPAASRLSVRIRGVPTEPDGVAETDPAGAFALPVNRCATTGERVLARLGPDEWLLVGPEADTDSLAAETARALAGRVHALVDVSHRQVALAVAGPDALPILAAGCPLDLHPRVFPPGSATRTVLGKAEIVLLRPGDAPVFRIECWRSFAPYVHAFLVQAARDV